MRQVADGDDSGQILPDGVRALNPDEFTGDINLESYKQTIGGKSVDFEVGDGEVRIKNASLLTRALESQLPQNWKTLVCKQIAESLSKRLEPGFDVVVVEMTEGPRLRIQAKNKGKKVDLPAFIQTKTQERVAAVTAAAEQNSTNRRLFLEKYTTRRTKWMEDQNATEILENASESKKADQWLNKIDDKLKEDLSAKDLKELLKKIQETISTLEEIISYEDSLKADAEVSQINLSDPDMEGLAVKNMALIQHLLTVLKTHGDTCQNRIEELTDINLFQQKWEDQFEEARRKAEGYRDLNLDVLDNASTSRAEITAVRRNVGGKLVALNVYQHIINEIRKDAIKRGIDLNLEDYEQPLADLIQKTKKEFEEVKLFEQFILATENALASALTESSASPDEIDTINTIYRGKWDTTFVKQITDKSRSLFEIDHSDSEATSELEAAQQELKENADGLAHLRSVIETSVSAIQSVTIPTGVYKESWQKQRIELMGEAFNKTRELLTICHDRNRLASERIEKILSRRKDVKQIRASLRIPKLGPVRKAARAVVSRLPRSPFKGVLDAVQGERTKRIEDETNKISSLSEFIGDTPFALSLKDGREVILTKGVGANEVTAKERTTVGEVDLTVDAGLLRKIEEALNDDPSYQLLGYSFRMNESDPAKPFVEIVEVIGGAKKTGTTMKDIMGGIRGARAARKLQVETTSQQKKDEKAKQKERLSVIKKTDLLPILEQLRQEEKPEEEARNMIRSLLKDEESMEEDKADAIFDLAWAKVLSKENSRTTRFLKWGATLPAKAKEFWRKAEVKDRLSSGATRSWGAMRTAGSWLYEHSPSSDTLLKAGAGVVGGTAVGLGLLGLGSMVVANSVVRGALAYGGAVGHQAIEKGAKVGATGVKTVKRMAKSPFTLIGSPLVGAYHGMVNGWKSVEKPLKKKPKGITAPFRWAANKAQSAWRVAKAAPKAAVMGALGLTLGALYQGPVNAVGRDLLGLNINAPVPEFMQFQPEGHVLTIDVDHEEPLEKGDSHAHDHGHGNHHRK